MPRRPPKLPADETQLVRVGTGHLRDAVDDAASPAAPEQQRVGAEQRFDPLDVVEIAHVLHVVADAIDEEAGGGTVAAQCRLVAVALTLPHPRAGDVLQHVAQPLHRPVVDQLSG